jgi:hypothetical protein
MHTASAIIGGATLCLYTMHNRWLGHVMMKSTMGQLSVLRPTEAIRFAARDARAHEHQNKHGTGTGIRWRM